MRNGLVLTRLLLISGMLLAPDAFVWGQEPAAPDPSLRAASSDAQTLTVAGRVVGQTQLRSGEVLVVMLLPGWSESLNTEVGGGKAPAVLLEAGRIARIVPPQTVNEATRAIGSFEFRNIPPGDYQPVAVRIKQGEEAGSAIAAGDRVIVQDRDIGDLELAIRFSADPSDKRYGRAKEREATVMATIDKPDVGPPISPGPIAPPPSASPAGVSRKREILEQVLVFIGIAAAMGAFSLW